MTVDQNFEFLNKNIRVDLPELAIVKKGAKDLTIVN